MDRDAARLAVRRREHHRFLAEHEGRGAAEKMRGDDGAAGRDRMRCASTTETVSLRVGSNSIHREGDAAALETLR